MESVRKGFDLGGTHFQSNQVNADVQVGDLCHVLDRWDDSQWRHGQQAVPMGRNASNGPDRYETRARLLEGDHTELRGRT
jgi:hypothetical protein